MANFKKIKKEEDNRKFFKRHGRRKLTDKEEKPIKKLYSSPFYTFHSKVKVSFNSQKIEKDHSHRVHLKLKTTLNKMKNMNIEGFRREFSLKDDFEIMYIALLRGLNSEKKILEECANGYFTGKPVPRIKERFEKLKKLSIENWEYIFNHIANDENTFQKRLIFETKLDQTGGEIKL